MQCLLVLLLLVVFDILPPNFGAKIPLPIMVLNPGGSRIGTYHALQLAVIDINRIGSVLGDYELQLYTNFTVPDGPAQPDGGRADYIFYHTIYNGPSRHMPFLLGPPFSDESELICQSAGFMDVIVLSDLAVAPSLFDREKCPTFYSACQSTLQLNIVRTKILQEFNWDKVAIIRYSNKLFSSVSESLVAFLDQVNITVLANEVFESDPANQVKYIKQRDARIIIGLFWNTAGRRVLCEAYKQGLYGPRYVWLLRNVNDLMTFLPKDDDPTAPCKTEQLLEAMEGSIITNWIQIPSRDKPNSVTGRTYDNFWGAYRTFSGDSALKASGYSYDTVLIAAATLNNSIETLKAVNKTLSDYTYGDEQMRQIFMNAMDDINIIGVTGQIRYNKFGDRLGEFLVAQIRDGKLYSAGLYLTSEGTFEWVDGGIRFANGGPPPDEVYRQDKLVTVSTAPLAVVCCISALGILLAGCLLAFNITRRNQRTIKMSSPNINNLIILGSVMTYVSIILNGVDEGIMGPEKMNHVCKARLWMLSLGFTIGFGSMLSKTWRVHKIFMMKKLERRSVKDRQLVTMVGVFVLMEGAYLALLEIKPLVAVRDSYESEAEETSEDLIIIPVIQRCARQGVSDITWLAGIYIFNGLLLVFGLFLAYETRNVKIAALNDSRNIGMSVYNVVILSSVGALFNLLMDPLKYETIFVVTSVCVMASTTTTLLIIFIPKMVALVRNPLGATVTTMPTSQNIEPTPSSLLTVSGSAAKPASGGPGHAGLG